MVYPSSPVFGADGDEALFAANFVKLQAVILRRTQKYACESRPLLFALSIENSCGPKPSRLVEVRCSMFEVEKPSIKYR
jgi:hypothetical protein